MQTIHLQVQDNLYNQLVQSGVDVHGRLTEFLLDMVDDGYPSVDTKEAKARVGDAIERYKNKTGVYTPCDSDYFNELNVHIKE